MNRTYTYQIPFLQQCEAAAHDDDLTKLFRQRVPFDDEEAPTIGSTSSGTEKNFATL